MSLSAQELGALRVFMQRVEPSKGVSIAELGAEIRTWQVAMRAIERELGLLAAASMHTPGTSGDTPPP